MKADDLITLVKLLRATGAESPEVEVKSAAGGLPKSIAETLSAFSNGHGGMLILGLDEMRGFVPVAGLDAAALRDALAGVCSDALHPPVRADIEVVPLEGSAIIVAEVPELAPQYKPCYVKAKGEGSGSYVRIGDGDRKLTAYEIQILRANHGQPRHDYEPVPDSTVADLDSEEVAALLRRVRSRQPQVFSGLDDATALRRLGVLATPTTPTLAGLLALGGYPQQFFPQLGVSFVRVPGDSLATAPEGGPRFLDNRNLDGPIPTVLADAVAVVVRNMSIRSYVDGRGRLDMYEYPVEAVREAVVNALIHRDYSPMARGSQIQVEMYADRLVVRSPGGLFGPVTQADLGGEGVSSSRNSLLVKLLADIRVPDTNRVVCENRASGIPTMIEQLYQAGLPAPVFADRLTHFTVTFRHPETAARAQPTEIGVPVDAPDKRTAVLRVFAHGDEFSRRQVQEATGLSSAMASRYLTELVESGALIAMGAANSPKRRYRLAR